MTRRCSKPSTQNIDIHDRTALKVFGADSGSAHELRRRAKIINYALLYGKQAYLAKDIGVPREEAQAFIDAYFAGFPPCARSSTICSRRRAGPGP